MHETIAPSLQKSDRQTPSAWPSYPHPFINHFQRKAKQTSIYCSKVVVVVALRTPLASSRETLPVISDAFINRYPDALVVTPSSASKIAPRDTRTCPPPPSGPSLAPLLQAGGSLQPFLSTLSPLLSGTTRKKSAVRKV